VKEPGLPVELKTDAWLMSNLLKVDDFIGNSETISGKIVRDRAIACRSFTNMLLINTKVVGMTLSG
jgi:hypothetical protein